MVTRWPGAVAATRWPRTGRTRLSRIARPNRRVSGDQGMAMVFTMLLMLLLSSIAAALALTTSADAIASEHAGASLEARYAAEAALERVIGELRGPGDLTSVLDGSYASALDDGAGTDRSGPGGITLRLDVVVNMATCARERPCTDAQASAMTPDRIWGARNPRWRLFAHQALDILATAEWRGFGPYVVVLVADDPLENDGDPMRDGAQVGAAANPGAGVLELRAEAFGRRNAHRILEATVRRPDLAAVARWQAADPLIRGPRPAAPPQVEILAWREIR